MKRIQIKQIYDDPAAFTSAEITVAGWARTIRSSNVFGFIELNDGSYLKNLQVVIEESKLSNYRDIVKQNIGASFVIKGMLVLTPEAKQPFELKASSVELEGASTPDYPLQKKKHTFEYLRTIAHLRPRSNTFNAVFRVRSCVAYAIHSFFHERGFVYVHTPLITGSDCEGAGEMFQVTTLDINDPPRTPDGQVDYSKDFFGKRRDLRFPVSSMSRPLQWRLPMYILSVPHSEPSVPTRSVTPPSSGWSNPKWHLPILATTWTPPRR